MGATRELGDVSDDEWNQELLMIYPRRRSTGEGDHTSHSPSSWPKTPQGHKSE